MRAPSTHIGHRSLLAGAGLLVLLAAIVVAVADPFAGHAASSDSSLDNGSSTSTRRVERTSLSSQTQVSGTLGYAGTRTVSIPSGTDPSALAEAEQALSSARATLNGARATASADTQSVRQARAALRAARRQQRTACDHPSSGSSPSSGNDCESAKQAVASAEAALTSAEQKAVDDETQLASAEGSLASAQQALALAESSATSYGTSSSYTKLPSPGRIVRRGQELFAIDGKPTLLLYGLTPAWRAFRSGMSPGADVAQLNANLQALGYAVSSGDTFTSATRAAISALQRAHGLPETGTLLLGSVVFESGALRVKAVTPTPGQTVQPGPLLTASSTRHDVSVALDAAQQSEVKAGDKVTITLPDNSTTPGVVSSVGKVATAPASDQSGSDSSSSPTINVAVRLLHPKAAGRLDQAPVEVSITEQSVHNVLAVPVDALVALAGGGYAVEEVEAGGTHRLVAVTPGLFDDAQGLVQVTGNGLAAGQRVVVPVS
jgi:peptidoglycan hydrolase-like protein with peptidoglycan-binding domain